MSEIPPAIDIDISSGRKSATAPVERCTANSRPVIAFSEQLDRFFPGDIFVVQSERCLFLCLKNLLNIAGRISKINNIFSGGNCSAS